MEIGEPEKTIIVEPAEDPFEQPMPEGGARPARADPDADAREGARLAGTDAWVAQLDRASGHPAGRRRFDACPTLPERG